MASAHVFTWNVNGLAAAIKKKHVHPETKETMKFTTTIEHAHVVFLQETHIGETNENVIQSLSSSWHLHYTVYDSKRRGVAILVNRNVWFEKLDEFKHSNGEYIILHCKIAGQTYILVSVYNHSTDIGLLKGLSEQLQQYTQGVLVIGGDFNTVLNPYMDKLVETQSQSHSALLPSLKNFMRAHQLVDVWRRFVKITNFYTFYRGNSNSRIDFFFMPEECVWRVERCDIEDIPSDDHLPISLYLITEDSAANIHISNSAIRTRPWEEGPSLRITGDEIIDAIKSLQVSDTPRCNGRLVSEYKSSSSQITHDLIGTFDRICDRSFNFDNNNFSVSFTKLFYKDFHFFNVDYVVLATILARHLECFLEPRNHSRVNYDTHLPIYYRIVGHDAISVEWNELRAAVSTVQNPAANLLNILGRMLPSDPREDTLVRLFYGCPLTPVLRSFLVRRCAEVDLEQNLNIIPAEPLRVYGDYVIAVIPRPECNLEQCLPHGPFRVRRGVASVLHNLKNQRPDSRS